MKKLLKDIRLEDILLLTGITSLLGGVAAIYAPAAFILAGLLLTATGILIETKKAK